MRRGLARILLAGVVGCAPFAASPALGPAQSDAGSAQLEAAAEAAAIPPSDAGGSPQVFTNFDDLDAGTAADEAGPSPFPPWSVLVTGPSLLVIQAVADARSKPNALEALLAPDDGGLGDARLFFDLKGARPNHVKLAFDMQYAGPSPGPGKDVHLAEVWCHVSGVDDGAWVELLDDGSVAWEGAHSKQQVAPKLDAGWTHLSLEARFDLTPPTVTFAVDDQTPPSFPVVDCRTGDIFEVNVGLSSSSFQSGQAFYDNVSLEYGR